MAFNAGERTPELAEIARAFGVGHAPEAPESLAESARAAVAAVARLLAGIGIPRDLADLGVPEEALPDIASEAMSSRRLVENNPRLLDEASALDLLRSAHRGDLAVLGEAVGGDSDIHHKGGIA
jgi:alcohol dehydrogenase